MMFNKFVTQILESLTTKIQPSLDKEREAYSVSVFTVPAKDNLPPPPEEVPHTIKVDFDEEGVELWSQWWDFNHDVLYRGHDMEAAFKVFCDVYRNNIKIELKSWKKATPEQIQDCLDTVEENIKLSRQCIETFKHIYGEWKVFDMGQYVDPLLVIGLEVDIRKYRIGGVIDTAADIAGDKDSDISEW